jgi:hypothetical protein
MSFSRIEVIELEAEAVEGGKPAGGAGLRGEAA